MDIKPEIKPDTKLEVRLPAGGGEALREVFIVLPGLNLSPRKLEPLSDFLLAEGHATALPRLRGYQGAGDPAWAGLSAGDWLADLDAAQAALAVRCPRASLSLLGFSMGALLGMVWSFSRGVPLERAILLSPAFRLKWYTAPLLAGAVRVLPGRLAISSRGPTGYALHGGTSLAAYGALLDLQRCFRRRLDRLEREGQEGQSRLPRQFLAYAPGDEMISTRYLPLYQRIAPQNITLHPLNHHPRRGFPRHLGVDAHTLGESEWAALRGALKGWLSA